MNEEARQSIIEELLAEGLTMDEIEAFMEIATMQKKFPLAGEDVRYAQRFTRSPTPQGRGYGGVYQSASPWEFVGTGLERIYGHVGRHRARQKQDEILDEIRKRRMGPAGLGGRTTRYSSSPSQPPSSASRNSRVPAQPAVAYPAGTRPGTRNYGWEDY